MLQHQIDTVLPDSTADGESRIRERRANIFHRNHYRHHWYHKQLSQCSTSYIPRGFPLLRGDCHRCGLVFTAAGTPIIHVLKVTHTN